MRSINELLNRRQNRIEFVASGFIVNVAAYASGNQLGPAIQIADGAGAGVKSPIEDAAGSAILQSVVISDASGQNAPIDIFFFSALPSFNTDHAAWAPTAADLLNCIGKVSLLAADYAAAGAGQSVACKAAIGQVLKAADASQKLWAVLVIRGAATYTASALQPRFQFSQGA